VSPRTEVRLLELGLVESLDAAHGTAGGGTRPLTVVRLTDGDDTGWGECAALGAPGYTAETAGSAFDLLAGGAPIDPVRFPMAAAALAMARLDLELRREGRSLAVSLGAERGEVPAGATVGLGPIDEVVGRVDRMAADGYRRVKVKVTPGHDSDVLTAVRSRHPDLELQVDANGSYGRDDLDALGALDEVGVTVIEQPVAVGDEVEAAPLVEHAGAVIVWDESVRSRGDAERLHRAGLLEGVSIKPGPLGGIAAAADLIAWAAPREVRVMVGGLLESGLGRHALAALAALPGVDLVGDLSPAGRWLADDPWADLALSGGRIAVPTTAGVAPPPDPDRLDAVTTRRALI
jgi:O-succinylbenzoate synthase